MTSSVEQVCSVKSETMIEKLFVQTSETVL